MTSTEMGPAESADDRPVGWIWRGKTPLAIGGALIALLMAFDGLHGSADIIPPHPVMPTCLPALSRIRGAAHKARGQRDLGCGRGRRHRHPARQQMAHLDAGRGGRFGRAD
jgi:hypothetical protein